MSTSRGHEWIVASVSSTLCDVITGGGTSTGSVAEAFRYDERNDTNTIRYELVLLDLGLPDQNDMTLLASLRQREDAPPVIITTARDAIRDGSVAIRRSAKLRT
ncbi:response regulator [Paraburkholderia heleia]|uniref:response regulator n=1 Tax=Paraburkholderia heleia TaxID=634127 RepID=UPI000A06B25C|nr:response regulator [Paraburkholderia heleia]